MRGRKRRGRGKSFGSLYIYSNEFLLDSGIKKIAHRTLSVSTTFPSAFFLPSMEHCIYTGAESQRSCEKGPSELKKKKKEKKKS